MRIVVCGGRSYSDRDRVFAVLEELHETQPISFLAEGGAPGADSLAHEWALERKVPVGRYGAEWRLHGRAAGPLRNQRMLESANPDLVVAFPGGRGTLDMVRRAEAAGVTVQRIER